MVHIKEQISRTDLETFARFTSNLQGKQGAMGSRKISYSGNDEKLKSEGECSFKNFVSHFNKLKEECGARDYRTPEENKLIDTIRMNLLFLDSSTTKGKGLVKVLNSISRKLGDIFGSINSKINKQFKSESADFFTQEYNIKDANLVFNSFKMISGKSDKAVKAQKELLSSIASNPEKTARWVRGGLGLLPQFLQLSLLKNVIIRPMKNNADDIIKTSFTNAEIKNYIQNELLQSVEASTDQLEIMDQNSRGMSIINKLLDSLGEEIVSNDPELNALNTCIKRQAYTNYDDSSALSSSGFDSSYEPAPPVQDTSSTEQSSSTEVLSSTQDTSSTTQSLSQEGVSSSSDIPLPSKDASLIEQSSSTGVSSSSSDSSEDLNALFKEESSSAASSVDQSSVSSSSSEGLNALFKEESSSAASSVDESSTSTPASPPPPSDMPPEAPIIESSSISESSFEEDSSSLVGLSINEFINLGAVDQLEYASKLIDKSRDEYDPDELIDLLPRLSVTDFLEFVGAIESNPNKAELLKNFTEEILLSGGPSSDPIDDSFIDSRFNSNFADSSRLKTAFRAMLVQAPLTSELSALTDLHSVAKEKQYSIEKSMGNVQKFLDEISDSTSNPNPYLYINNMNSQELDQLSLDFNYLSRNLDTLDTYFNPEIKLNFYGVLAHLPKQLILSFAENPKMNINLDENGYVSDNLFGDIFSVLYEKNYSQASLVANFLKDLLTAIPPSVFADPNSPVEPLRHLVPKAAAPLSETELNASTPEPTSTTNATTAPPPPPPGELPPPPKPTTSQPAGDRGDLLSQIQKGTDLKKVKESELNASTPEPTSTTNATTAPPPPPPGELPPPPKPTTSQPAGDRGDLLSQIQKGKDLKSVEEREINQPRESSGDNDLLNTLVNAMDKRRGDVDGGSEESSEDSWSSSDSE